MEKIGRLLKEEERRFIDYSEIESRTTEMGFPMSVRTLRFYVDEGILPAPRKVGKKPVYDEHWILNALLSIHIMKTRLNRSLKEIRLILGKLTDEPSALADQLAVLYEDFVKGGDLKPVERDWLIETFFALLTGKGGGIRQPSAIKVKGLAAAVKKFGRWRSTPDGQVWDPPTLEVAREVVDGGAARIKVSIKSKDARPSLKEAARRAAETPRGPMGLSHTNSRAPRSSRRDQSSSCSAVEVEGVAELGKASVKESRPPEGAVSLEEGRGREEFFLARLELEIQGLTHVVNPLSGKALATSPRTCYPVKRDHSASIIQRMKSRHIYDRELLDAIPLERAAEYHIYRKGFFGRGEVQVVVAGLTLSPIDDFIEKRYGASKLGSLDIQRAISELVVQDEIFYYLGLFSTTGWTKEALSQVPQERNLLCCLVEKVGDSGWRITGLTDERWGDMGRLFDPETDGEKVGRVKRLLLASPKLSLRGGHVVVSNIVEDLAVSEALVRQAMDELIMEDPSLSMVTMKSGIEILKRSRF